ncbi:MAG: hypothetical protein MJ067_05885, partial [Oscillospiraceae bacterium]|nr:hypothetical protein [Oscillospiraceae bacterium]
KLNTENIAIIEVFSTSDVHLGVSKNHPMASLPIIPASRLNELKNENFLLSSQYLLDNGRRKELQRMMGFETPINVKYLDFVEPELALRYVGKGLGVLPLSTFVPKEIEDVVFIPMECKNPTPVSLYYVYKRTNASRALKLFTKYIEEEASKAFRSYR